MSGRTGKMTREQVRARGPRFALVRIVTNHGKHLLVCRENQCPFIKDHYSNLMAEGDWYYVIIAKSYTLRYLVGLAAANR